MHCCITIRSSIIKLLHAFTPSDIHTYDIHTIIQLRRIVIGEDVATAVYVALYRAMILERKAHLFSCAAKENIKKREYKPSWSRDYN